jgi:hypothetical protein
MKRRFTDQSPFSLFSFQDIITSVMGVLLLVTLLLALNLTLQPAASPAAESHKVAAELRTAIAEAESELESLRGTLEAQTEEVDNPAGYTKFSALEELRALRGQIEALQAKKRRLQSQSGRMTKQLSTLEKARESRTADVTRLAELKESLSDADNELADLKSSNQVTYNIADHAGKQVFMVELFPTDILAAKKGERAPPLRFMGSSAAEDFKSWAASMLANEVHFMMVVHPGSTEEFEDIYSSLEDQGYSIGFDLLPNDKNVIDLNKGAD